jgi:hypothetical protein
MSLTYYKRFRMEVDLDRPLSPLSLPAGYFFVPWDDSLVELHAAVHYHSFVDEIDAALFPSFGDPYGCRVLFHEICAKPGFLAEATWMIACADGCVGSVQGVCDRLGVGSIQNIGVVPSHRNQGLGRALLMQALIGFRSCGIDRAYLEVTADNTSAVRLYQSIGFRRMKTVYKAVDE